MNLNQFLEWSHQCLLSSDTAQEYLLGRGVSHDQMMRHNLGFTGGCFSPDPREDSSHGDGCKEQDNKNLWCDTCKYIRWSTKWVQDKTEDGVGKRPIVGARIQDCIVFPLTSYSGTNIGFQVRSIVEKQYDTYSIKRRPEGYFFGVNNAIHSIWNRKSIILVEGPFDHLIMERLISSNVVALVTSAPGKNQTNFIKRFADVVYCCLDNDKAGKDGFASIGRYLSGQNLIKLNFPSLRKEDKDVGDLWKRVGDSKFKTYFKSQLEIKT